MSKILRDISLRDFGASLNTVESYTNESSQGKIGLCETANKQKCIHLGTFLASEPVDSIDENSAENQTTELLDKISAVMKSLNPVGKTKAKEALSAENLPIKPTEMKKITDIKTLERVLEVISKI